MMNNYIVFRILRNYAPYLSWEYQSARYEIMERVWGRKDFGTSWESCMTLLHNKFGMAMSAFFYNKHVENGAVEAVSTTLFNNMHGQMCYTCNQQQRMYHLEFDSEEYHIESMILELTLKKREMLFNIGL